MTSIGDWRNGVYNEQKAVEVRYAILNHAWDTLGSFVVVYVPRNVAVHAAIHVEVGVGACACGTWARAHHRVAGLYVGVAIMGAHDEDDELTPDDFAIRDDSPSHLRKLKDSQLPGN